MSLQGTWIKHIRIKRELPAAVWMQFGPNVQGKVLLKTAVEIQIQKRHVLNFLAMVP